MQKKVEGEVKAGRQFCERSRGIARTRQPARHTGGRANTQTSLGNSIFLGRMEGRKERLLCAAAALEAKGENGERKRGIFFAPRWETERGGDLEMGNAPSPCSVREGPV